MNMLLSSVFLLVALSLAAPAVALQVNETAPPISLRDSNNDFFYLSNYVNAPQPPLKIRGGKGELDKVKGIIVNFFSSTCKPCKNELPVLNSLVDEFEKKSIKVVIIGYKENFDKFIDMLDELKVDKPIILADPYGKAGEKYGVYGLPLTVFIGADGKVKDIIKGELPNIGKVLREKAKKLLK
ncbi:MAG: TlpA family protein disulfide reductase [Nitrospirae bacterium]|nr:MAG: TlpA family protein disulfide reductase [Nitrospirota bacterium]